MSLLTWIFLVLAVIAVILWLRSRGNRPKARPMPAASVDPLANEPHHSEDPNSIKIGDELGYGISMFTVRGSIVLRDPDGYTWTEHYLDDLESKRWLSVETEDGEMEVILWEAIPMDGLKPDSSTLTYGGEIYKFEESGRARYTARGTTTVGGDGEMQYADFAGPAGKWLSLERYDGGQWEAGVGETVPNGLLTIYPSSAPSA